MRPSSSTRSRGSRATARSTSSSTTTGNLANAYFQVPELRGFEVFCRNRPVEEMPRITTRICGVCPEAHHLASVKAADAVYGVTPPRAALKLRELMYNGFFAGDHTTHFFALGGPDFVVGPDAPKAERNILGVVAKVGLGLGAEVIRQRARGQRVVQIIGGKALHPVTALPGGMSKRVTGGRAAGTHPDRPRDGGVRARRRSRSSRTSCWRNPAYVDLITLRDVLAPDLLDRPGRSAAGKVNFYDGTVRIVDPDGREFGSYAPAEYLDHLAETVLPYTYLKYPYLEAGRLEGHGGGCRLRRLSSDPDEPPQRVVGHGNAARAGTSTNGSTRR